MTGKRGYGEACPVAHSLDMIGDRWALLVVRELRLGPRRFTDLQASLPGAGPNVLSQRLRDLEESGVLRRRTLPPPAGVRIYELTQWGAELEPVFRALARWGMSSPNPRHGGLTADTVMLGIRTFWNPQADPTLTATYQINLGRDSYRLIVVDGRLDELARGEPGHRPDASITAVDRLVLHRVTTGDLSMAEATQREALILDGDKDAARRLIVAITKPAFPR